jgi:hypothetical protein
VNATAKTAIVDLVAGSLRWAWQEYRRRSSGRIACLAPSAQTSSVSHDHTVFPKASAVPCAVQVLHRTLDSQHEIESDLGSGAENSLRKVAYGEYALDDIKRIELVMDCPVHYPMGYAYVKQ